MAFTSHISPTTINPRTIYKLGDLGEELSLKWFLYENITATSKAPKVNVMSGEESVSYQSHIDWAEATTVWQTVDGVMSYVRNLFVTRSFVSNYYLEILLSYSYRITVA